MLVDKLNVFTDREDIIDRFVELLNNAQRGQFYLLAIKGNSGTGKTFLIEYLSHLICPKLNWHSAQFSLAQSKFDFRSFLAGLEAAFRDCVSDVKFKEYCNKRDEYNQSFSEYRAYINVYQSANAKENALISNNSFEAKISIQLREREQQLFSEWSRALIKLAEDCERPLCLFADSYLPSLENDDKHNIWLGGDLLLRIAKSSPYPVVSVICGWNWPTVEIAEPLYVERFELKDFNPFQISNYLEKRQISNIAGNSQSPQKVHKELVQTLYELTKGHPLVLDIAVTFFDRLDAHERSPEVLNAKRNLVDEKARVDFLGERLLSRLSEPYRTLLERGAILRTIGQKELQQLLNVQTDGVKNEKKILSDREYEYFLQYPFISMETITKDGSFEIKPVFHDLVRDVRLASLRSLHPQTKKMLHVSMMCYYRDIIFLNRNYEYLESKLTTQKIINIPITDIENQYFDVYLEYLYHALQTGEYQENAFSSWVDLVGRAIVFWKHKQARLLLALIQQLSKEGEPFLSKTSYNYGLYLVWYERLMQLESHWSEGIVALEDAIKIFEKHQDSNLLSTCFNNMSTLLVHQGKLEQSLDFCDKSLKARNQGDNYAHASYLMNTAMICQIQGDLDKALNRYEQALSLLGNEEKIYGVAVCLDNIGTVHQSRGDLEKALTYHKKAQAIFEEIGLQTMVAMSLNHIGEIYRLQGEQEKALTNHKQALLLAEGVNDNAHTAIILNNIGCDYDYVGNSDVALNYFNQALVIHEQINSPTNTATTLNNIGLSYCSQCRWEEALECFIRGLNLVEKVGDILTIASCYNQIGLVYFYQKNLEEAMVYYIKALLLKERIGDPAHIAQTIHNIGDIYAMKSMYDKANEQFVKALNLYKLAGKGFELDVADELESLAFYKALLGEKSAEEYLMQAQEIRTKMRGVTHINHVGPKMPFQFSHAVIQQLIYNKRTNSQQNSQGQESKKKRKKRSRRRRT